MRQSLSALNSRLSRHVVSWVFLSLVAAECIVLVPSYFSRERELLKQLEDVSSEVVIAVKGTAMIGGAPENVFNDLLLQLKSDSVIVGGSLYSTDSNLLTSFGEMPDIEPQHLHSNAVLRQRNENGNRYDVAWPSDMLEDRYILVVRHDSSNVKWQMLMYVARIAGVVFVIAVVVTSATFLILERFVITPILQLRDDLCVAGDKVGQNKRPAFRTQTIQRNDELGEVTTAFHIMFRRIHHEIVTRKEVEAALRVEQEKSERLLLNILPLPIAEQLKRSQHAIAHRINEATILFADLVDFTGLAAQVSPIKLVNVLNQIFSKFDHLAEDYGLEKIKTIGDAYMVVGGVTNTMPNHAEAVMEMAIAMQSSMTEFVRHDHNRFQIRIGINTGPVVAGVIGVKKFSYDLWGDAVNIASRMESHGLIDKIHISEATYAKVSHLYDFDERGDVYLKGRGTMKTYVLLGRKSSCLTNSQHLTPSSSPIP